MMDLPQLYKQALACDADAANRVALAYMRLEISGHEAEGEFKDIIHKPWDDHDDGGLDETSWSGDIREGGTAL
jgi:hypothetical protein